MPCARCSLCAVNYPLGMSHCRICAGQLDPIETGTPHHDWEDRVSAAAWEKTAEQRAAALEDDVVSWRLSRFLELGVDASRAEELARDRTVDHHALVELIGRGCPLETAIRIITPA